MKLGGSPIEEPGEVRFGGHLVAPGPAGRLRPLLAPAAVVVETLHSGEDILVPGFGGRF